MAAFISEYIAHTYVQAHMHKHSRVDSQTTLWPETCEFQRRPVSRYCMLKACYGLLASLLLAVAEQICTASPAAPAPSNPVCAPAEEHNTQTTGKWQSPLLNFVYTSNIRTYVHIRICTHVRMYIYTHIHTYLQYVFTVHNCMYSTPSSTAKTCILPYIY